MDKRKKKTLLILICLLFVSTTIILVAFENTKKTKHIEEDWSLFKVPNIQNPEQIIWVNNDLFIKEGQNVKRLDWSERKPKDFLEIQKNENVATYENEIVLLSYENQTVFSPDEIATNVSVFNMQRELIFSKSFYETLIPLYIENGFLFLMDNYLNSPERTYRVNLEGGEMELFEIKEKVKIKGEEKIQILDENDLVLLEIPKVNDIRSFSANENFELFAFVDKHGYLWIYFKKSILSEKL